MPNARIRGRKSAHCSVDLPHLLAGSSKEQIRLFKVRLDIECSRYNGQTEHEWQAPAARLYLRRRHSEVHHHHDESGEQETNLLAGCIQACVKSSPSGRRALHHKSRRAADLARAREPLKQTREQDDDGRPNSDGFIGRRECYQGGSEPHDGHREIKSRRATDAVSIDAKNDRPTGRIASPAP